MVVDYLLFALTSLALLGSIWGAVYGLGWAAHRSGSPRFMAAFRIVTFALQVAYVAWAAFAHYPHDASNAEWLGALIGFGVVWWIRRHWSDRPKAVEV